MRTINELLEVLGTFRSEREVDVLGNENLGLACEALIAGRSVLVYSNFPHVDTVYQLVRIHWLMASFGQKSFKLFPGTIFDSLNQDSWELETVAPIYRYLRIGDKRNIKSVSYIMAASETLSMGGLVTLMPEVVLSEKMIKADPVFGRLALQADLVLPILFESSEKLLNVHFLYPFDPSCVGDIRKVVGNRAAGNLTSDYLMAMLASKLPVEARGHFVEDADWFLDKARPVSRFQLLNV